MYVYNVYTWSNQSCNTIEINIIFTPMKSYNATYY